MTWLVLLLGAGLAVFLLRKIAWGKPERLLLDQWRAMLKE